MEQNLLNFLITIFTLLTVFFKTTADQGRSLRFNAGHIKNNKQKNSAVEKLTASLFKNLMAIHQNIEDHNIHKRIGRTDNFLITTENDFTKFSGKKMAKSHTIYVSQKTAG
jgi:hypothetical protein